MTVFEMHLQVNQRLQEVASYKRDKLFPQEIDMALNKAVYRLLEKGVDTRFQDSQINLSHVAALIKKNKINEVIVPAANDLLYEENLPSVYSMPPPDLYWLINGRAEIIIDPYNCGVAPTLASLTITEYVATVPFLSAGSAPYFANVVMSSSIQGVLYNSPSQITAGFNSSNSAYVVINNILDKLYSRNGVRVYWERYRDVYAGNSFIVVSALPIGTVSLTATGMTTRSGVQVSQNYSIPNRSAIAAITNKKVTLAPVKVQKEDTLYSSLKENQFYKTRPVEVIMDQTHDYFILYRDESFLVTRMAYDYIRKPRTISLALNQSCELADTTHPKIIDLAVELLRLDTKDAAYPATANDINQRTK